MKGLIVSAFSFFEVTVMDLHWERSFPYYHITLQEFFAIYPEWKQRQVIDLKLITIGCRNSNYEIKTFAGKYLLRISSTDNELIQNEIVMNNCLTKLINSPKLIEFKNHDSRYFLIYEFVEGLNFSYYLSNNKIENSHIASIAEMLAKIHSLKEENYTQLIKSELPPFETWYDYFLDNHITLNILGQKRVRSIKDFIRNNTSLLSQISSINSFIHSDFRPANMLLTPSNSLYLVDWEYCTTGHSLADIGQFFRYRECFNEEDRQLFAITYNNFASIKLPVDWYYLSRIRDLINPLQMLATVDKKPQQQKDLLQIVDKIVGELIICTAH